ncbi:MAG: hypothetical protein JO126_05170 [Alphaproteobacteria bacterium]|nr:hypothetical protein [Alphaproteobacteria bacterium]MBV8548828.1 hypothetical protein [Alphaproteobacteria bacterium]
MTKDTHDHMTRHQEKAEQLSVRVAEDGDDEGKSGKGKAGGFAGGAGALTAKEVIAKDSNRQDEGDYHGIVEEGLQSAERIASEKEQRVQARTVLAEKMAAALERLSNDTLHKLFQAGLIDTRTAQKLGLISRTITSILSAAVDTVAINLLSYEQKLQIENRTPHKPNAVSSVTPPRHDM